jgi:phosphoribosylaminoimidazole-succinocarboxamide synthase
VKLLARGKVRDIYEGSPGTLILVASDRISAFDVVMAELIPEKGRVLTGLTLFWLSKIDSICPTHFITADPARFDDGTVPELSGRSMMVRRAQMVPLECVARGYLFGTVLDEYQETGSVAGVGLPSGLRMADRLPQPIFSPAVKSAEGHDENVDLDRAVELHGGPLVEELRHLTLAVYEVGARLAEARGIILADTKLEFGLVDGELTLCDEVLTPDSSRYWDAETYRPGISPPSFDKQFLRDFLSQSSWDRSPPPPSLPEEVIKETAERYVEAYERIAEERFAKYLSRMTVSADPRTSLP